MWGVMSVQVLVIAVLQPLHQAILGAPAWGLGLVNRGIELLVTHGERLKSDVNLGGGGGEGVSVCKHCGCVCCEGGVGLYGSSPTGTDPCH